MKVIINPPKPPRKEYTNLPEREPHRELLRKRRASSAPAAASEERATFGPAELTEQPYTQDPSREDTRTPEGRDFLADLLSDREPENDVDLADEYTESDQEQHEHSWKNSRWVPLLFVGALALLGAAWYFATHFEKELPLERITVEGAHLLKDQEIISLAGIDRNEKFYKIDLKQIEANLLRHSLIKAAHPRRAVNPSTIVLAVEERQPVAMIRSEATGEAFIIDRDGVVLRPKLLAGLRNPEKLLQVPLISGISEKDTASYHLMARLVMELEDLDSGALRMALGEMHRTPTGAYVLYTVETQTPIFIGSPTDVPFHTALEDQLDSGKTARPSEPLFERQIKLLAKIWKHRLEDQLRSGTVLYVDARFSGQVIVKPKASAKQSPSTGTATPRTASAAGGTADSSHPQLLTSAEYVRIPNTSVITRPTAQGQR